MNTGERVAPVAAVVSAVSTLLCCLPLSFVGALGAASLSTAVLQYRGWLIAASVSLLAIGFIQVYRRSPECRRRSRLSLVVLWTSAIAVTVCYNFFGLQLTYVEGATVMPPGQHQVRMEFAYDGGGLAKGGTVSLSVDGKKAGEGRIGQTEPFAFGEESLDVGHEAGSPVTTDYPPNRSAEFTGQVNWVEFDAGTAADDHNHLITPEERLQVAMAKQ